MSRQNTTVLSIAPYRFLPAVNGGHKGIERFYYYFGRIAKTLVISVKSNDDTLADHYQLLPLFANSFLHYINVFYFFRVRKLMRQQNITHLISEHPYMGWLCILLRKSTGVPFVVHSHNIEALRFKTLKKQWWKVMWQYEKWILNKADFCFFISEEDKAWAVGHYQLAEQKCSTITYGMAQQEAPLPDERAKAKKAVCLRHHVSSAHRVLLFNGDLGYEPNRLAVEFIITEINPRLSNQTDFLYIIFICGRNLDEQLIDLIQNSDGKIIYTGFVADINEYVFAADIFINPIVSGGGIKTKLVEALATNCSAVSAASGAGGVPVSITNGKLKITADNDWQAFAEAIIHADITRQIGSDFYKHFYWGNIARKALDALEKI